MEPVYIERIVALLVETLTPRYRATFLDEDRDGLWFINPFTVGIQPGGTAALVEDGWDPYEVSLRSLGEVIDSELLRLRDVGQLAKWGWLKKQHTAAVAEYRTLGTPRLFYLMAEVEKIKKAGSNREPPS
jgi:hypothetical protein